MVHLSTGFELWSFSEKVHVTLHIQEGLHLKGIPIFYSVFFYLNVFLSAYSSLIDETLGTHTDSARLRYLIYSIILSVRLFRCSQIICRYRNKKVSLTSSQTMN